jgi:hypothetical protein
VDGRSSSPAAEVETLLAIALRAGKVWLKVLMRALMVSAEQLPARSNSVPNARTHRSRNHC